MDIDAPVKFLSLASTSAARKIDPSEIADLVATLNHFHILSLLVKTIHNDDENSYQDADRIEHVYNSVKLIRNESLRAYLQLVENFYLSCDDDSVDKKAVDNAQIDHQLMDHLLVFMNLIAHKSLEDLELLVPSADDAESTSVDRKNESVLKLAELVFDLFSYFDSSKKFNLSVEQAATLVDLIKKILLKFAVSVLELCVRFSRILGLIAIRMRNTNLEAGKSVIKVSTY